MTYVGGFNVTSRISCVSANNNTLLRTVRKGVLPNITTVGNRWLVFYCVWGERPFQGLPFLCSLFYAFRGVGGAITADLLFRAR